MASFSTNAAPTTVEGLLEHAAITDAIYRLVDGLDRRNDQTLASAYAHNARFEIGGNVVADGLDAILQSSKHVQSLDTTHFLSNIRIFHKAGDKSAKATATAMAKHYRPNHQQTQDNTYFLDGCLYDLELVKEGDLWKTTLFKG